MVKNLATKVKNARLRKLPVMLALIAALVIPAAVRAYADDPVVPEEPVVEAPVEETPVEEEPVAEVETPPADTPAPEPTDTEAPVTPVDEEVVTDPGETTTEADEDPLTDITESFDRYIAFAQAEHPGVAIEGVVYVYKHGVKSAKITFVDGWKVYIGVSDSSTLLVADAHNKVRECQKRMRRSYKFSRWYLHYPTYYQWWQNHNSSQGDEEPAGETEEQADPEAQVQGASTQSRSSRKTNKSSNAKNNKSYNTQQQYSSRSYGYRR